MPEMRTAFQASGFIGKASAKSLYGRRGAAMTRFLIGLGIVLFLILCLAAAESVVNALAQAVMDLPL